MLHPVDFNSRPLGSSRRRHILRAVPPSCLKSHKEPTQTPRMSLMSTTNQKPEKPWLSLDILSAEILALIFEELYRTDRKSLWTTRRVSRRIEAVATPILYRTLVFNRALVKQGAANSYPGLRGNIEKHTLEVVISSDLNPAGIRDVLSWASRLQLIRYVGANEEEDLEVVKTRRQILAPSRERITDDLDSWNYANFNRYGDDTCWLIPEALSVPSLRLQDVALEVNNLPLQEFTNHDHENDDNILTRTIPISNLTSLVLGHPAPPLTQKLPPLKRLLLRCPRLHTLHYEDRGQGTSFRFDEFDGKMPPVKDLMLRSYDWDHSREEVAKHWDLSNLRSLQLVHVPMFNFLSSIDPEDLRDLRHLRAEDFSAHLPDRRQEATKALSELVGSHITSLETLDLVCHVPLFSFDALLRHRLTLQVLRLRDHTGFGEEEHAVPTVGRQDLERLAREMPYLHTLELDMDVTRCNPRSFLGAVCRFGSLHTLTIHVQTLLRPLDAVEAGSDRDFEAAMATFRFLLDERDRISGQAKNQQQHERPLKQQSPHQERHHRITPWRRITINVGGWRRVMVRRVSMAWRERNERGIFAERCFVLERSMQHGGQVGVREEIGVESPSRRATPEL